MQGGRRHEMAGVADLKSAVINLSVLREHARKELTDLLDSVLAALERDEERERRGRQTIERGRAEERTRG